MGEQRLTDSDGDRILWTCQVWGGYVGDQLILAVTRSGFARHADQRLGVLLDEFQLSGGAMARLMGRVPPEPDDAIWTAPDTAGGLDTWIPLSGDPWSATAPEGAEPPDPAPDGPPPSDAPGEIAWDPDADPVVIDGVMPGSLIEMGPERTVGTWPVAWIDRGPRSAQADAYAWPLRYGTEQGPRVHYASRDDGIADGYSSFVTWFGTEQEEPGASARDALWAIYGGRLR